MRRRIHTLALMSFSSGMPVGFLINGALVAFLRSLGLSLTSIGLLSLTSFAFTLKFLWSPLIDRFAFSWPGRRRSWVLIAQGLLAVGLVAFAGLAFKGVRAGGFSPSDLWLVGALGVFLAFCAATQDIALDAYAVEFLRPEEQAMASGLRNMYWRIGWLLCSGLAIALSDPAIWTRLGVHASGNEPWPWVILSVGVAFVLVMPITLMAKEPEEPAKAPQSLRLAVVDPFLSFVRRPDALWFAAFLILYRFGDNISISVWTPFLIDHGITLAEIGILNKTVGTVCVIGGALLGGALTPKIGLGRALWLFGLIQGASSLSFAMASISGGARWAVYFATAAENISAGLGSAAQATLVLRLCDKRFGATQFALLTSVYAIGRLMTGPIGGLAGDVYGYTAVFLLGAIASIPGLLVLRKIAPLDQSDVPSAQPVAAPAMPVA